MKRFAVYVVGAVLLAGLLIGVGSTSALTKSSMTVLPSATQATDFYMIFAGDTQYPWTDQWKSDGKGGKEWQKNAKGELIKDSEGNPVGTRVPGSGDAENAFGEKRNRDHIKSMQTIAAQVGNANLKGIVINGDLTNFGQPWQLDKYKQMWDQSGLKIYPGLGNHDYANNVDDCFENRCATGMVQYMHAFVTNLKPASYDFKESGQYYKFPQLRNDYKGSLAYSWDIGDVHFVQLHNYPAYTRSWNAFDAAAARRNFIEITSSMDWLRADLTKARNEGKKIILNMHDVIEHFPKEHPAEYSQFETMVRNFKVSAIFVGHIHENQGQYSTVGDAPVFYSGAASFNLYLLAHFKGNELIVEKVSGFGGGVTRTPANRNEKTSYLWLSDSPAPKMIGTPNTAPGGNTYSLISDRPATPAPPPVVAQQGQITFFNEGGYVAKYTLVYFVNGKPVVQNTGDLALGNRKSFALPSNATNIAVKGEAATGLVWAPWKTIFDQSVATVSTTCFKSYGTTLAPKWSYCK